MAKKLTLVIALVMCFVLGGCSNVGSQSKVDSGNNKEVDTSDLSVRTDFSTEEIYASVQNHLEWGLFDKYADYFLNYLSDDKSLYYYNEASAEEIFDVLKRIYDMQFDYAKLEVDNDGKNVVIRIPVKICDGDYVYTYEGEWVSDNSIHFINSNLYDEDKNDVFGGKGINNTLSVTVDVCGDKQIVAENALKSPDPDMVGFCQQHDFMEENNYKSGLQPSNGKYYLNGDKNSDKYYIINDNQIEYSEENGNKWYYKTLEKDEDNYIYYGYSLNSNGFSTGLGIKYTENHLETEVDGSIYILCE